MTQHSRGRRRGAVFSLRVSENERAHIEAMMSEHGGPRALGPWLVWRATAAGNTRARPDGNTRPGRADSGNTRAAGNTRARPETSVIPARAGRVVLDLCGGTGAWSAPYRAAGYDVRVVTLPQDVRTFVPPERVHGILGAPPCEHFSIARNGHPSIERDFVEAMSCVNAIMRIVLQTKPMWWVIENPSGHLAKFLGRPRFTFEPHEFGDSWTKRTCLWGDFVEPTKGPFVVPTTSAVRRSTPEARAITPPGFARAFFEANP